jgi:hypothetical protein
VRIKCRNVSEKLDNNGLSKDSVEICGIFRNLEVKRTREKRRKFSPFRGSAKENSCGKFLCSSEKISRKSFSSTFNPDNKSVAE